MKLTEIVQSGKRFGELFYLRGITMYKLSPFELKTFYFGKPIGRVFYNRVLLNLPYVLPPMIIGYMIYTETQKKYERMCRKNPQDFINDK